MEQISCTEFLEKYDPDKIYKNKHQFPIIGALLYELSNPKSYCFNLYTKSVDIYFTYKEEPIVLKYFINKLEYEDDTPFKTHYNSSFLSNDWFICSDIPLIFSVRQESIIYNSLISFFQHKIEEQTLQDWTFVRKLLKKVKRLDFSKTVIKPLYPIDHPNPDTIYPLEKASTELYHQILAGNNRTKRNKIELANDIITNRGLIFNFPAGENKNYRVGKKKATRLIKYTNVVEKLEEYISPIKISIKGYKVTEEDPKIYGLFNLLVICN